MLIAPSTLAFFRKSGRLTFALVLACSLLGLAACERIRRSPRSQLIVWAWERAEDLRFVPKEVEIAAVTGFVEIGGDSFSARGRRFPLLTTVTPTTAVVHVQIDDRDPPVWTPILRRRVAAAVTHFARAIPVRRVQIDFEVRQSQRPILVDLIRDMRASLPRGVELSMTALASWCQEDWLQDLPVDEIVPMLFRMGRSDPDIRRQLERDWREPACRRALAISTDTPISHAPSGRRVYLFNPRSWTRADFELIQKQVEKWR